MLNDKNERQETTNSNKSVFSGVVSGNTATGHTKTLTEKQRLAFGKALQESYDQQARNVFGVSPKFEGTFVWPIPKPDDSLIGIIKLNVTV